MHDLDTFIHEQLVENEKTASFDDFSIEELHALLFGGEKISSAIQLMKGEAARQAKNRKRKILGAAAGGTALGAGAAYGGKKLYDRNKEKRSYFKASSDGNVEYDGPAGEGGWPDEAMGTEAAGREQTQAEATKAKRVISEAVEPKTSSYFR